MKRSRKLADVSEDSRGETFRKQPEGKAAVPSMSAIFMDAATTIDTNQLTEENLRKFSLDKYNMDITKHINNLKTMTRSAVQEENKKMLSSKAKDLNRSARKIANEVTKEEESNAGNEQERDVPSNANESNEDVTEIPKKNSRKNTTKSTEKNTDLVQETQATGFNDPKGQERERVKKTAEKLKEKLKAKKEKAIKKGTSKLKETNTKKKTMKPKGNTKTVVKKDRKK